MGPRTLPIYPSAPVTRTFNATVAVSISRVLEFDQKGRDQNAPASSMVPLRAGQKARQTIFAALQQNPLYRRSTRELEKDFDHGSQEAGRREAPERH
jgi:hypothetical protein